MLDAKLSAYPALRPMRYDMDSEALPGASLDLVLAIHVLCHSRAPRVVLQRIFEALRPGGILVVADIGRPLVWSDWARYTASALLSRFSAEGWGALALIPTIGFFLAHRKAAAINRELSRRQEAGLVWTHTLEQFVAALRTAGFEILEADDKEYRGVDSLAVAEKPGRD